MTYMITDVNLASPEFIHIWNDHDNERIHASVELDGGTTIVLDSPAEARALAAEIVEAAEAMEQAMTASRVVQPETTP